MEISYRFLEIDHDVLPFIQNHCTWKYTLYGCLLTFFCIVQCGPPLRKAFKGLYIRRSDVSDLPGSNLLPSGSRRLRQSLQIRFDFASTAVRLLIKGR